MKVIDLTKISKTKLQSEIHHFCGRQSIEQKWLSGIGKGFGGLTFKDPQISTEQNTYKCNLAFYELGIGIYFRNSYANYLILVLDNEIEGIELHKPSDRIRPYKYSLYSLLVKIGLNPIDAAPYLMPKEIIEEYPASFTIRLNETYFYFTLGNVNVLKFKNMLSRTKFAPFLVININEPQVIHAKNNTFDQTTPHQNHSI